METKQKQTLKNVHTWNTDSDLVLDRLERTCLKILFLKRARCLFGILLPGYDCGSWPAADYICTYVTI